MTRNQKIALGCGGAGCLGLIVVVVASAIAFMFYQQRSTYANRNYNINTNQAESTDSPPSDDTPSATDDDTPSSTEETSPSEDSSASSMSDDDKHKLFQAAAMTGDSALNQRVWRKLGLTREDGRVTGEYEQFVRDHVGWTVRNVDFIQSISAPERARAYVDEHIND